MEKFLILQLDEESQTFVPARISDVPIVMDPSIPDDQRSNYSQIKLTGEGIDINTLSQILFPAPEMKEDPFGGVFDTEISLEENLHDRRGEVPGHEPGS